MNDSTVLVHPDMRFISEMPCVAILRLMREAGVPEGPEKTEAAVVALDIVALENARYVPVAFFQEEQRFFFGPPCRKICPVPELHDFGKDRYIYNLYLSSK